MAGISSLKMAKLHVKLSSYTASSEAHSLIDIRNTLRGAGLACEFQVSTMSKKKKYALPSHFQAILNEDTPTNRFNPML